MIARCPDCKARYLISREKLGPRGARLKCTRCKIVFLALAPENARGSSPAGDLTRPAGHPVQSTSGVLLAEPNAVTAERLEAYLDRWGVQVRRAGNGGQAVLQIFREPPALVLVGLKLPGLPGAALTEIVRRAPHLAGVRIIRVALADDPAEAPEFESDLSIEPSALPDALGDALRRFGIGTPPESPSAAPAAPRPAAKKSPRPKPVPESPKPRAARASTPPRAAAKPPQRAVPKSPRPVAKENPKKSPSPTPVAARRRQADAGDDPLVAEAKRLARIVISDIVLYNEDRFDKAARENNLESALRRELDEGRALFSSRISEEVRAKADYLSDELASAAAKRLKRAGQG
ncbi:MAG: MJ0042-type zinc finger domain-containing protein [Myxococcota bacterium]